MTGDLSLSQVKTLMRMMFKPQNEVEQKKIASTLLNIGGDLSLKPNEDFHDEVTGRAFVSLPGFYVWRVETEPSVKANMLVFEPIQENQLGEILTTINNLPNKKEYLEVIIPVCPQGSKEDNVGGTCLLFMERSPKGEYQVRLMDLEYSELTSASFNWVPSFPFSRSGMQSVSIFNRIKNTLKRENIVSDIASVDIEYPVKPSWASGNLFTGQHMLLAIKGLLQKVQPSLWISGKNVETGKLSSSLGDENLFEQFEKMLPAQKDQFNQVLKELSVGGSVSLTEDDSKKLTEYGLEILDFLYAQGENVDFSDYEVAKKFFDAAFKGLDEFGLKTECENLVERISKANHALESTRYPSGNAELVMAIAVSHALDAICEAENQAFSRGSIKVTDRKLYDFYRFVGQAMNGNFDIQGKRGVFGAIVARNPVEIFEQAESVVKHIDVQPRIYDRNPNAKLSSHYRKETIEQYGMDARLYRNLEPLGLLPHRGSHILFGLIKTTPKSETFSSFVKFEPHGLGTQIDFYHHTFAFLDSLMTQVRGNARREKDVSPALFDIYKVFLTATGEPIPAKKMSIGAMFDSMKTICDHELKRLAEEEEALRSGWMLVESSEDYFESRESESTFNRNELNLAELQKDSKLFQIMEDFSKKYHELYPEDEAAIEDRTGNEVILTQEQIRKQCQSFKKENEETKISRKSRF